MPDIALANSGAVVDNLHAEGFTYGKVHLIYNGVKAIDPSLITCPNSRPNRIICVANIIPYKGHVDLIKAFSIIVQSNGFSDFKLYLVGNVRSNFYHHLISLICELSLSRNICFVSDCTNPNTYLLSSRLAVLPSHQEGFSNSLLEYMAARLPIVATSVGGNTEAIVHMKNGLIVPPRSPGALASAMLLLLSDPVLSETISHQAYLDSLSKFSDKKSFQSYQQLYNNFLPLN